jgi:hypothetical protein
VNPISAACSLYPSPFCSSFPHSLPCLSMTVFGHIPLHPAIQLTCFDPVPHHAPVPIQSPGRQAVIPLWCWKEHDTPGSVRSQKTCCFNIGCYDPESCIGVGAPNRPTVLDVSPVLHHCLVMITLTHCGPVTQICVFA